MSVGQVVGGIVGGVIGFFAGGNVMLGASIGMSIGGYIDPPKGPKIEGPRLSDLSVQSATYGAQIPRIYGTIATFGNIFWVENNQLKETSKTESQDAKGGGGGAETTTYTYSATFALGLCQGPIEGIKRVWCSGKLIYDAGSTSVDGLIASQLAVDSTMNGIADKGSQPETQTGRISVSVYLGTDDQLPDPRMQATLGVANTPAYRGLAYIVFNDFDLTDFGNSLMGAQFKVEVMQSATWSDTTTLAGSMTYESFPDGNRQQSTIRFDNERFYVTYQIYNGFDTNLMYVGRQTVVMTNPFPEHDTLVALPPYDGGVNGGNTQHLTCQSDEDISFVTRGVAILSLNGILAFNAAGTLVLDTNYVNISVLPYADYIFVVDRGDIYATNMGKLYHIARTVWPAPPIITASAEDFDSEAFGASENYLFMVVSNESTTTTTIKKVSRATLATVETLVYSYDSRWASLHVVSDTLFYIMSSIGGPIHKWDNGVFSYVAQYQGPQNFGFRNYIRFFALSDALFVFFADNYADFYTVTKRVTGGPAQLADIIETECLSSGLLELSDIDVTLIDEQVEGYKVTQTASIRSALEPLQSTWPFDVIPSGHKLKFVPRGQSSVASVTEEELAATAGGENDAIRVTNSREMDIQLPRRVNATYLDINREYDVGTGPGAERLNTDAVNEMMLELPIVMDATKAAGVEEVLLYMYWMERNEIVIVLPPTYIRLEPSDVITVTSQGATYEIRLTSINYLPDGRLECTARYNNAAVYTPAAVGEEGLSIGQVLAYEGPTELVLMDVPRMTATQDAMGLPFGMWGYASGWKSGVLVRSDDMGASYQSVAASNNVARVFKAESALPSAPQFIIDKNSTITVRALVLSSTLSSVTESQLYAHSNLAAIGANGRWEIIAFQTATDLGDGIYTLKHFLRGLYGTEQNIGNHIANDLIVMLDTSLLSYCGMPNTSLGIERLFRAVSNGKPIDSAYDVPFTYYANNLKPLAPVDVRSYKPSGTSDYNVSWTRRTRMPVEVFSGVTVPLGETTEAYEVDIWDPTWTKIVRTVTGLTSANMTYTLAQMITDFGEEQTAWNVDIYQMSTVVGRGNPARTIIRRPGLESLYAPYIVSGLHFNGTNGSTVFKDVVSANVWTALGNAQIVTDATAFGGFSGSFDGTGDVVTLANGAAFTTPVIDQDWTASGWITPASVTTVRGILSANQTSPTNCGWNIYGDTVGQVIFGFRYGAGGTYTHYVGSGAGKLILNTRTHIAVSKKGRVYRIFVNGVMGEEKTLNDAIYTIAGTALRYGHYGDNQPTYMFTGKMDDWCIHMNACLYEKNFTPPTEAFVDR